MSDCNGSSDDSLKSPNCKKVKTDDSGVKELNSENGNGVSQEQIQLQNFIAEKILSNNTTRKTVIVQGKFKDQSGVALVILEKSAFKEEELDEKGYFSIDTDLHTLFHNDIYGNFVCFPRASINGEILTLLASFSRLLLQVLRKLQGDLMINHPHCACICI